MSVAVVCVTLLQFEFTNVDLDYRTRGPGMSFAARRRSSIGTSSKSIRKRKGSSAVSQSSIPGMQTPNRTPLAPPPDPIAHRVQVGGYITPTSYSRQGGAIVDANDHNHDNSDR